MQSSRLRSVWRISSFKCWSSVPPALCTMHLGNPVVPDEYMMYTGWSNGNRSKLIALGSGDSASGAAKGMGFTPRTGAFIASAVMLLKHLGGVRRYPSLGVVL